jgi:hypothetical protein
MKREDPIVAEIRAIRDAHAAQYDYDLRRIGEALMAEQAASGRELYYGKPKPVPAEYRPADNPATLTGR